MELRSVLVCVPLYCRQSTIVEPNICTLTRTGKRLPIHAVVVHCREQPLWELVNDFKTVKVKDDRDLLESFSP